MKLLITGASGFVGRHCINALAGESVEVHAQSFSGAPVTVGGAEVTWHRADLLNPVEMDSLLEAVQPTHLLHLAWTAKAGVFWTDPANLDWVGATFRLARRFSELGGQRMVAVGSCAEYDWAHPVCLEGDTPLHPATLYGVAKNATREVLEAYFAKSSVSFAWGRLFWMFGPYENLPRLVAAVVNTLRRGERFGCTDGLQVRDFMYGPEVGSALVKTLFSEVSGAINIASGQPVQLRELIGGVANALGAGASVDFGSKPRPAGEPDRLVADVTRLRHEVGWQPAVTLEGAIAGTLAYWEQQAALS